MLEQVRHLAMVSVVSICLGPLLSSALPTKTAAFSCCSSSPSRIPQEHYPQLCLPLAYHGQPCKGAGVSIPTDATGTVVFVLCYCHQSKTWGSREVEGDGKQRWRSLFHRGRYNRVLHLCWGSEKVNQRPDEQTLFFSRSLCFGAGKRLSGPPSKPSLSLQSQLTCIYLLISQSMAQDFW